MNRKCLFIALEAISPFDSDASSGICPATAALLADYHALGYHLVAVAHRDSFGLESESECSAFRELMDRSLRTTTGVGFETVILVSDNFDPRPVWEAARRHSLDLSRSVLLTKYGAHAGLCRTSGVSRVESSQYVLSAS